MSRFFLLAVLAGLWLAGVRIEAQVPLVPVSESNDSSSQALEHETFLLINRYRAQHDLPALVWDAAIAKIARVHSRDMASGDVDFGHEGFGDRMDQLRKSFVGMRGGGENVLMTDNPNGVAQAAVALWLKSPPHLHNIRGDFNYSGMGIWVNRQGVIYFTQIFVKLVTPDRETGADPNPPSAAPLSDLFASPTHTRTEP